MNYVFIKSKKTFQKPQAGRKSVIWRELGFKLISMHNLMNIMR